MSKLRTALGKVTEENEKLRRETEVREIKSEVSPEEV